MKTTSIHIAGQIISNEIFDRFETGEIKGQLPKDFGFDSNIKVKEEIASAWADAKDQWRIFKRRTEKLRETDSGVTETRKYWIIPLLENLGYKPQLSRAETVNGKSYAISHRDENLGGFPIHIVGVNNNLDKRAESGGARLSPHALVQDYLNVTEHLYGLVTNGYQLRLLRDSGKLIRLTYLEFDLQQMMEDDLFAEFAFMYRLIHASRMPQKQGEGDQSLIEQYHQDSLESGARIREGLSGAVEKSIVSVANGFLKHPANEELRSKLINGELSANDFNLYLLRLIYRILFLLVIEERDIVYASTKDNPELKKLKEIYYNYYSVSRLRKLAEDIFLFDESLEDLWIALRNTFKIFGSERLASKLGIYPLDGDLFGYDSLGILSESNLDNHTLLECIRNLCIFENPQTKAVIRVNYAALNVEEFGSVYEGLLEKAPELSISGNNIKFYFKEGTERSSSGSHYTPEELVQPLIKHSLDYVIEDKLNSVIARSSERVGATKQSVKEITKAQEEALLSIKVCDVAAGSGHILLAAARRIAMALSRVRTGEDQPSPGPYRKAMRDVISNCIYGVDKNPLAVELCKVALWLEAHNPGMPLNFLDHKIKCGDSIVGLARIEELKNGIANEAFKTLPEDDKEVAALFRKTNKEQIKQRDQGLLTDSENTLKVLGNISQQFKSFNLLPDDTVEHVAKKREEFNELKGSEWWKLKEAADLQVAQFFIPKTEANKQFITTDSDYFRVLAGQKAGHERKISTAMAVAAEKKFFHWFLEFPEVFAEGKNPELVEGSKRNSGFDVILGNPPFLGGQRLSGTFGPAFLEWVKYEYAPAGSCDLVTYFFRRVFELLRKGGFQSLISTNTIAQGGAREGGLDVIREREGTINFAVKSMRWPGEAAVEVSLVAIHKGRWNKEYLLGNKKVKTISSYLDDSEFFGDPFPLKQNQGKSFQGSIVLGKGFVLTPEKAKELIDKNPKNKDVLFPYLNGEDLNSRPDQSPSRWVINFFDWPLRRTSVEEWNALTKEEQDKAIKERIIAPPFYNEPVAADYSDCLSIVERDVKPERIRWKKDANGNEIIGTYALRKPLPQKWWIYAEKRPALYSTISGMERVLVTTRVTKTHSFNFTDKKIVFSDATVVLALLSMKDYLLVQSNVHEIWAWNHSSTMKGDRRYAPSDCFETFPFPQYLSKETEEKLEKIGEEYHEFRRRLMLDMQLGLTKTYNLFHNGKCRIDNVEFVDEIREFKQAKLQIPIEEAVKRIEKLRQLHKEMDEAVLEAYGWGFGSAQPIDLAHNFYEVDYLPENDRVRYTISPEARKEVLKRLLELNHKIHEEEVAAGLWEKRRKKSKGKSKKFANKGRKDTETGDLFGGSG